MRRTEGYMPVVIIILLGLLGGILRGFELIYAIDVYTGIYDFGIYTVALPIVSICAVIIAFISTVRVKKFKDASYEDMMEITGKLPYVTGIVSGAVLAVAGFLSLINSFREVAIGQIIINMLFALLTICCGAAYICIISKRRKGKLDGFAQFLLNVPLYWSCFLFIFTFIEHPVEPVIPIFAYDLLASCASVFAIYKFSALAYGRKSIYMAVVSSLCALFFIVTSAVGRFIHIIVTKNMYYLSDAPFRMVCFLGILLMLITELSCVISNGKKISRNLIFKENKADE